MAKFIINQKYVLDTSSYEGFAYDGINKELEIHLSDFDQERLGWRSLGLRDVMLYDEVRKAIENEVWEFATICTKMDDSDSGDVFGGFSPDSFTKFSYQEAKTKYDTWKQEKDNVVKQKVSDLAEEIGIHRLYAIVREIRGE